MAETFLVLGSESFYGKSFAACCEAHGDRVFGLAKPAYDVNVRGTIMDVADYVVDFIAKGLVRESWDDPHSWVETNFTSKLRLLDNLRQFKLMKKYIHVSTPEVYGSTPFHVMENARYNPSTPYAVSKASFDMMLMAYNRSFGFPAIITRTTNIYGAGQQPYRLIPSAFRALLEDKPIALHGGGVSVRDWIHVSDACEATYLLAKEGDAGIYHIGTEREFPVSEVVKMIGARIESQPLREGHDDKYLLCCAKMRGMGWEPKVKLEEGLKQYGN